MAYIPGLAMRRSVDLYPGEAKADVGDSYVLANTPECTAPGLPAGKSPTNC